MIGSQLLQHLAQDAGYAIAKLPSRLLDWRNAVQVATGVARKCGEHWRVLAQSIEDLRN